MWWKRESWGFSGWKNGVQVACAVQMEPNHIIGQPLTLFQKRTLRKHGKFLV